MHGVFIVGIVFGGIVMAIAIIAGTILMAIRIRHGGFSPRDRMHQTEETGMIQEIYQGLARMEERVESLETILMDTKEKDSQK